MTDATPPGFPKDFWVLLDEGLWMVAASRADKRARKRKLPIHDYRDLCIAEVERRRDAGVADHLRNAFRKQDKKRAETDRLELRARQRTWDERKKWR